MAYFQYHEKKIFYTEIGQGKPLLFLHGNTASSKMFTFLLPMYQSEYQVILMDFLGNGNSERMDEWPAALWVDWGRQAAALIRHLDIGEKVSLVGTSGGAWAAINAALECPELVEKVVADSFDASDYLRPDFAQQVVKEREATKSSDAWQFYQWCQGEDWERVVEQDTSALVACAEQQLSLFVRPIERLQLPLLLTGSREDEMLAPEFADRYRQIQQRLPQTELCLFEKGGHPAILTNAEAMAQRIKNFLK